MKRNRARDTIIVLALFAVIVILLFQQYLLAFLLGMAAFLAATWVLYRHLPDLTDTSKDNPKMGTLQLVAIFSAVVVVFVVLLVVLMKTGAVTFTEEQESYFAGALTTVVVFVLGNICPKLPFNRYVGLRLPWTVRDEDTWIMAHRILGYLTLPTALINIAGILLIHSAHARDAFCVCIVLLFVAVPSVLSLIFYWRKFRRKL